MPIFRYRQVVDWSPGEERRAERNTILSTCCGAMGEVPFTDAALIILYANMLGANDCLTMITTSLQPLTVGLLAIPASFIAMRSGSCQRTIMSTCLVSLAFLTLVVTAPFFGRLAIPVLLAALAGLAVSSTVHISAWFPLLSTFLKSERRSMYLGKMRFCWQFSTAVLLTGLGFYIGRNPPIGKLQVVMLVCMIVFSGRFWLVGGVPTFRSGKAEAPTQTLGFSDGLKTALANKPLTGYSVYLFILNLAAYGTIPLVTLYLKKSLRAPDNVIVFLSAVVLCGMLTGSFCAGPIIKKFGIRTTFLCVHAVYAATNFLFFFMSKGILPDHWLFAAIGAILFLYSVTFACASISSSTEMMHLAASGNKVMAMAFCNSFYYGGSGLSRLLSSLILGSGALAAYLSLGGMTFSHYQTLFLVYGVGVVFAASLLVVVPAIFPKGEYFYSPEK